MRTALDANEQDSAGFDESLADSDSAVPPRSLNMHGGGVWIPLSFVFLLVGTVLGFQVALSVRSQIDNRPQEDPYALKLTATRNAGSVHLRWDRQAPAMRHAQRGILWIQDDGTEKTVELDLGHLRHGSVIYRSSSDQVQFRLEVFLTDSQSVSESIEFAAVAKAGS